MAKELEALSLDKTHTWDLFLLPIDRHPVGCKWTYKVKTRFDGSLEHYKARLVAKGYKQGCPDITFAVHLVSQFVSASHTPHYVVFLHILCYAHSTLQFYPSTSAPVLQAYTDANWAGDVVDQCSTTGHCVFLDDSLIAWKSKRQFVVSLSSSEAEYHTAAEIIWLGWLLSDLNVAVSYCTPLH